MGVGSYLRKQVTSNVLGGKSSSSSSPGMLAAAKNKLGGSSSADTDNNRANDEDNGLINCGYCCQTCLLILIFIFIIIGLAVPLWMKASVGNTDVTIGLRKVHISGTTSNNYAFGSDDCKNTFDNCGGWKRAGLAAMVMLIFGMIALFGSCCISIFLCSDESCLPDCLEDIPGIGMLLAGRYMAGLVAMVVDGFVAFFVILGIIMYAGMALPNKDLKPANNQETLSLSASFFLSAVAGVLAMGLGCLHGAFAFICPALEMAEGLDDIGDAVDDAI